MVAENYLTGVVVDPSCVTPLQGTAAAGGGGIGYAARGIGMSAASGTGSGTNSHSKCPLGNHRRTYAGSMAVDLDGMSCDCGEYIFKRKTCSCCGNSQFELVKKEL